MNRKSDLKNAKLVMSDIEYKKYVKWVDKPFIEKYPHLSKIIFQLSLITNLILLMFLCEILM